MKVYEKEADELMARFENHCWEENLIDNTIICLEEKISTANVFSEICEVGHLTEYYKNQIEYLKQLEK